MNETQTTTAVANRTGTDIVFDPQGKLQFKTYAAVLDFTGQLVAAGMAPKGKTKEQCAICIAFGLPMGMDVLAAIQNIAVINGMPCIWGDALVGLVMASGLLEDIRTEYLPSVKECTGVKVTAKRKGVREPFVGMFSKHQAEVAGLWGKQGPWTQYPVRMMLNRARTFALRDGFPDVLKGMRVAEEVEDTPVEVCGGRVSPAPYEAPKKPVTAAKLIDASAKPSEASPTDTREASEPPAKEAAQPAPAKPSEAPAAAESGKEPF